MEWERIVFKNEDSFQGGCLGKQKVFLFDELRSWGYHSDDGKAFSGETRGMGKNYGPTFERGDTVGCGLNNCGEMFFSLNGTQRISSFHLMEGIYLGIAFSYGIPSVGLHPIVGIDVWGTISANFGQSPFLLEVGKYAILSASQRPGIYEESDNLCRYLRS